MQRHVDPQEVQEVLRLTASRQAAPEGPTVEGLAEALGLPVSEVERMLAQIRGQHAVPPVAPRRSFGDRSAALSAAIVLALVLVVALVGGGAFWLSHRGGGASAPPMSAGSPDEVHIEGPDGSRVDVSPGGGVHIQGPSGAVVAPAAPAAPATPSDSAAEGAAFDQKEALARAQEALRQAEANLKSASEADRAQAQAQIEAMKAELKKRFGEDAK